VTAILAAAVVEEIELADTAVTPPPAGAAAGASHPLRLFLFGADSSVKDALLLATVGSVVIFLSEFIQLPNNCKLWQLLNLSFNS
jgi:hypothetical protein